MGNSVAVAASSTVRLSKAGVIFCFIAHSRVPKTRDQDSNFGTNVVYSLGRAEFRFGSKADAAGALLSVRHRTFLPTPGIARTRAVLQSSSSLAAADLRQASRRPFPGSMLAHSWLRRSLHVLSTEVS